MKISHLETLSHEAYVRVDGTVFRVQRMGDGATFCIDFCRDGFVYSADHLKDEAWYKDTVSRMNVAAA